MKSLYLHLQNEPDELPHAFQAAWLNTLQIEQLPIQHERDATYLRAIQTQSYDCVFVSRGTMNMVSRTALRNWFRVLRPNGRLFLLGALNAMSTSCIVYATPITDDVDFSHSHFVCLRKKAHILPMVELMMQSGCVQAQNHHAEALSILQLALLAYPDEMGVYQFLTLYYERMNWLEQAKEIQEIAFQQFMNIPQAALARFMTYLSQGDYERGFALRNQYCQLYLPKRRRSHAYPAPHDEFDAQYWQGENLTGKTFVVWSEFGLGDEIMFAQLAHYLKRVVQVAKLIWVVQPPLVQVMQTHADIDEVVSAKVAADILTQFDYWAFPHDLLVYFRQPFAQMPKALPYLAPQADKLAHFAELTRTHRKMKVGLAWRGDPTHENDAYRSLHNVSLLNVLLENASDIQFYCIQKELNDAERLWLAENQIPHFGNELNDFADTAALLANMDLLITVDTSVAHLAGALNLRTFVVLPYVYDWRWGTPLMQNLWYPNTMKFHFPHPNATWHEVLLKVRHALQEWALG